MSFSNTDYIYDHLPSRFRRDDKSGVLKRYLQIFGATLDGWDEAFDAFWESINPETASEQWVKFWLLVLFGWSKFPWWFTLANKRQLYANFARHLGRRGTPRGIELFLKDFGIVARVHTRPVTWGEFVWGETSFSIAQPLYLIVEILQVKTPAIDACYFGEGAWGEAFYSAPRKPLTESEIVELVRYQQPHAQVIDIFWKLGGYEPVDYNAYWQQISW